MKYKIQRTSDFGGRSSHEVEINSLDVLEHICEEEGHKLVFDSRTKEIHVLDEAIYCDCGIFDGDTYWE